MKQAYKITYPIGKTYIGKDLYGNARYMGSPDRDVINEDFERLPREVRDARPKAMMARRGVD